MPFRSKAVADVRHESAPAAALFDAIADGDTAAVRRLLTRSAAEREGWLRAADVDRMTPLLRAVRRRDGGEMGGVLLDAVRTALRYGAVRSRRSGTRLQWEGGKERSTPMRDRYRLDLRRRLWSRVVAM